MQGKNFAYWIQNQLDSEPIRFCFVHPQHEQDDNYTQLYTIDCDTCEANADAAAEDLGLVTLT